MTYDDLKKMREKATKGEWIVSRTDMDSFTTNSETGDVEHVAYLYRDPEQRAAFWGEHNRADLAFIAALVNWFDTEAESVFKNDERYRKIRLKAWLDSCVDDLVVGTQQARESEFNSGYDQHIDIEYPDAARKEQGHG